MLKDRSWFTQDTEILTTEGWVSIEQIHKIEEVICLGENLERCSITEFNKYYYNGDILKYKTKDLNFYCKKIMAKDIWRVDKKLPLPEPKPQMYSGMLYNVVTKNNNIIVRTNSEDYILVNCVK